MDCHEAKDRLVEGRRTAAVARHLEGCPDCAAFAREAATGGRELAHAFLATAPSPDFESRVAGRLSEAEISVRPRPRRLLPAAVAASLLVLAGVSIWLAGSRSAPPIVNSPADAEAPAAPVVVTTEPIRENRLLLYVDREGSAGETRLDLSFAGSSRSTTLSDGVEEELLRAWAMGARRAEITVGERVPGREITVILDGLEKTGYSYDLVRRKP